MPEATALYGMTFDDAVSAARSEIQRIHLLILEQEPEPGRIKLLVKNLISGQTTISDIVASLLLDQKETIAQVEAQSSKSNKHVVQRIFRLLLSRDVDATGLELFGAALSSGSMTVLQLVEELIDSEEFSYRLNSGALIGIGSQKQKNTDPESARRIGAEKVVNDVFNIFLRRDAEEAALHAFGYSLIEGDITVLGLIKQVCESPEFGAAAIRMPAVANYLANGIITAAMQRSVTEGVLQAYSNALQNGMTVEALVDEMIMSQEFSKVFRQIGVKEDHPGSVPSELAQLTEGLLVNQMVGEGCLIAASPYNSAVKHLVSEKQMAALVRTLAMMAETVPR